MFRGSSAAPSRARGVPDPGAETGAFLREAASRERCRVGSDAMRSAAAGEGMGMWDRRSSAGQFVPVLG